MITQKDLRRLLETRHDLDKTQDPAALTARPGLQAALSESHLRLSDTRVRFLDAYLTSQREANETDAARLTQHQARERALARYRYTRAQGEHAMLSVDPDDPIPPDEFERRERMIATHLPPTTTLLSLGEDKLTSTLEATLVKLRAEPSLDPGVLALDKLQAALEALQQARITAQSERLEDSQAVRALRQTRDDLDTEHSLHTALVRATLTAEGRTDSLGLYIKALDPAYRKRRRSNAPLEDEPDLEDALRPSEPPA